VLFNSLHFLVFLPVVLLLYFSVHSRFKNWVLLLASSYFYMVFPIPLAALLVWSTFIDFYLARRIHQAQSDSSRKLYLIVSMVSNLGLLFLFKYYNLFAYSIGGLLGSETSWVSAYIVLPMGISFYTFQTMSYTIDVYRGELEPTDSLLKMALYVSFFPQLVAGPIMRGKTLMPQLDRTYDINIPRMKSGAYLCVWGLMKKTFIADPMGRVVDSVYPSSPARWLLLSLDLRRSKILARSL
jgi:alginate O-acetyltransferase complex protein AlgI